MLQKFHLGWLLLVKKNIEEIPMKATSWNQSQEKTSINNELDTDRKVDFNSSVHQREFNGTT
jgi:hypothetical protein